MNIEDHLTEEEFALLLRCRRIDERNRRDRLDRPHHHDRPRDPDLRNTQEPVMDYDTWRLSPPEPISLGTEEGQTCNRLEEEDEDQPRGYKRKRCLGTMTQACGEVACETCGEIA